MHNGILDYRKPFVLASLHAFYLPQKPLFFEPSSLSRELLRVSVANQKSVK